MMVLPVMMVFAVYALPQRASSAGLQTKHLGELEDDREYLEYGQRMNPYLIPKDKLQSNAASEIELIPEAQFNIQGENIRSNTTGEGYDKTLVQTLVQEEEESMLVAGLNIEKTMVDIESVHNSTNSSHRGAGQLGPVSSAYMALLSTLMPKHSSTPKSNRQQVLEGATIHPSQQGISATTGQSASTNYAQAAWAKSAETGPLNATEEPEAGNRKPVMKPTSSAPRSDDKKTRLNPSSKTRMRNNPMKSKVVTETEKTEEEPRSSQKEHFPFFMDDYCPSECACYGRVVQCSDKGMDNVPYGIPYNSRYILLMNNHINRIQVSFLSEHSTVEFLALSNNRLTDGAVEGVFEGIPTLKRLYLDSNRLQSVPGDLPKSLEELRLDNNQVGMMSETAWSRCPGLLILSMSNNSLGNETNSLPNAVLSPLCKLQMLNLDYNQLTSVPLGLPLSVKEIYLKGNRIEEFRGGAFNGKAQLVVLDLSGNRLTNRGVHKDSLINASHLESLNLENNRLKKVPQHLSPSLKTLNLEGNYITAIKKSSFGALTNLEHLSLARNKILKVVAGAFKLLPVLHQLDLGHNALRRVPRQLPKSLHSVALSHNRIQTVPLDAFCWGNRSLSLSGLVRVQLQSNAIELSQIDTQAFRCLRGFQVVHFY